MTSVDRWLLPDGIDEILPPEARRIEQLRRELLDYLDSSGYQLVIPPALEYLESLLTGTGKDLDIKTFKVTDQLSGRMMGLSADTTPQVARIDAHSWAKDGISRFSYCRTVFHTKANSLLASRTPMQVGAELYGDDSEDADIEIISILISVLARAGIESPHIDIGSVGVVRAVINAADLNDRDVNILFELIQSKCASDIMQWTHDNISTPELAEALAIVAQLQGSYATVKPKLDRLIKLVPSATNELQRVTAVLQRLGQRFPKLSIMLDLSELRGFDYHTSLVFAAYVSGYGDAIAQGGRYDETGAVFGRARPATGFSADLKILTRLSDLKQKNKPVVVVPNEDDNELWQFVNKLRLDGYSVIENSQMDGAAHSVERIQGQWQLVKLTNSSD